MFSSILKELRTRNGVSQSKLSKSIGVSAGNISDWESDRSKPGYSALVEIARFFEVSADYLLELDPPPVNTKESLNAYKKEQGLVCDGSPLSDAEADLVAIFRLLPPMRQEELFDLACFQYERHVERKKKSIYWTFLEDEKEKEKNNGLHQTGTHGGIA